ncbi:hypothetical protein OPV22_007441 [Ensete ventricosum]|uniref:Uncharacterized protein n=1 Tax=Ensete ventricosum TaxID=4639 RepID=A0AAV8RT56_ENSVE|nr:hypothetical protein OPV22_007441 [Ensete ventricosum]
MCQMQQTNSGASDNLELSTASRVSQEEDDSEEITYNKMNPILTNHTEAEDKDRQSSVHKTDSNGEEADKPQRIRFLDLNELAPGTSSDDGPSIRDYDQEDCYAGLLKRTEARCQSLHVLHFMAEFKILDEMSSNLAA